MTFNLSHFSGHNIIHHVAVLHATHCTSHCSFKGDIWITKDEERLILYALPKHKPMELKHNPANESEQRIISQSTGNGHTQGN